MTPGFVDFLELLGDKVQLESFKGYSGGLDTKSNTHGTSKQLRIRANSDTNSEIGKFSYYTDFKSNEVMFHVGPMIPRIDQDISRKRHVGNDVVVIIYKDDDCSSDDAVDLTSFKSHFNRTSGKHKLLILDQIFLLLFQE